MYTIAAKVSKSAQKILLIIDFGYKTENQCSNSGSILCPIFSRAQNKRSPAPDFRRRSSLPILKINTDVRQFFSSRASSFSPPATPSILPASLSPLFPPTRSRDLQRRPRWFRPSTGAGSPQFTAAASLRPQRYVPSTQCTLSLETKLLLSAPIIQAKPTASMRSRSAGTRPGCVQVRAFVKA